MITKRLSVKLLSILLVFNLILTSFWPVWVMAQMECDPAFGNFCDSGSSDSGGWSDFSPAPWAEMSTPEVSPEPAGLNYGWTEPVPEPSQTWQEPSQTWLEPADEPMAESVPQPQSPPVNTDTGSLNYGQPEPQPQPQSEPQYVESQPEPAQPTYTSPQDDPAGLNYTWQEPVQEPVAEPASAPVTPAWDVFTDTWEQDNQISIYQDYAETQAAQISNPEEFSKSRSADQSAEQIRELYGLPGTVADTVTDTISAAASGITGIFDQGGPMTGLSREQQQELAGQGQELAAKQEAERAAREKALTVSDWEKAQTMAQLLNLPPDSSPIEVVDNLNTGFNKIGAKIEGTPSDFTINWDPFGLGGDLFNDPFVKTVRETESKCREEGKSGQDLEKCLTAGIAAYSFGSIGQLADSFFLEGLGSKAVDFLNTVQKAAGLRTKAGWDDNGGNNPWAVAARNGDSTTLSALAEANDANIKLLKDLKDHPEKIAELQAADRKPYISGLDWSALGTDDSNLDQIIANLETERDAALATSQIGQKQKDLQTSIVVDGGMVLYGGAAGELVLRPVVAAGKKVIAAGTKKVASLLEKRSAGVLEEVAEKSFDMPVGGGTMVVDFEPDPNTFQKLGQWAQKQVDNARRAVNLKQASQQAEADDIGQYLLTGSDQQRATFQAIIDEGTNNYDQVVIPSLPTRINDEAKMVLDKSRLAGQLDADYVGEGAYGMTFVNKKSGVLTKVFKDETTTEDLQQIAFMTEHGGKADIPELTGIIKNKSGKIVGFKQEFISDAVSLKEFRDAGGTLTRAEADEAVASLVRIHEVTGSAHGDLGWGGKLHTKNIMVQTVTDGSGNSVRKVRFVDFAGVPDPSGELKKSTFKTFELDQFKGSIQFWIEPWS